MTRRTLTTAALLLSTALILPAFSPQALAAGVSTSRAGIGATAAQMKRAHGVSFIPGGVCSAKPHCYGPVVRNEEGFNYLFTSPSFQNGLLIAYTQAFPSHTTLAQAQADILQWLPTDSQMGQVTTANNNGTCAVFVITSATLAKLFSKYPKIQDPQGMVAVDMGYIDANLNNVLDPSNVEHANLFAVGPTITMPNGSQQASPVPAFNPSEGCS